MAKKRRRQPTQILALPLVKMTIVTGNNEDWIDTFVFMIEDEYGPQLDLRGMDFDMYIRRRAGEHEVILHASTDRNSTADGNLAIGAPPNVGYLIIYVPLAIMQYKFVGSYVGDIVARDDMFDRRCVDIDFSIVEGVTR